MAIVAERSGRLRLLGSGYIEPIKSDGISARTKNLLEEIGGYNMETLEFFSKNYDSVEKNYNSFGRNLANYSRLTNEHEISSEALQVAGLVKKMGELEGNREKKGFFGRIKGFFNSRLMERDYLETRKQAETGLKKISGLLGQRDKYLSNLKKEYKVIDKQLQEIREIKSKIKEGVFDYVEKLNRGTQSSFSSYFNGNVNDQHLGDIGQMFTWVMESGIVSKEAERKEAERVVKGESFIPIALAERPYVRRDYFAQEVDDWKKRFSDEEIERVMSLANNYKVLSRIEKKLNHALMQYKKNKFDLGNLKTDLGRYYRAMLKY